MANRDIYRSLHARLAHSSSQRLWLCLQSLQADHARLLQRLGCEGPSQRLINLIQESKSCPTNFCHKLFVLVAKGGLFRERCTNCCLVMQLKAREQQQGVNYSNGWNVSLDPQLAGKATTLRVQHTVATHQEDLQGTQCKSSAQVVWSCTGGQQSHLREIDRLGCPLQKPHEGGAVPQAQKASLVRWKALGFHRVLIHQLQARQLHHH